jgi:phage tail sheath protein FI
MSPGVTVNITNAPAPTSRPSETGKFFVVGQTERGGVSPIGSASIGGPIIVHSISELKVKCGEPVSGSQLYPGLEEFFAEGGNTAIVGREIGSAAAVANSTVLVKAGGTNSLKLLAKSSGAWGSELSAVVAEEEAGAKFSVVVKLKGETVETKLGLASVKAAVEWAEASEYVSVQELTAGLPKAGTYNLTGGSNGAPETTAAVETALKLFFKDLGCGQVAVVGNTTAAVQEALLLHCETNGRIALVDLAPAGATLPELKNNALTLRNKTGARRGAAFSTWATIPGVAPNTTRTVPWSCVQAGILARNDGENTPPHVNEAAAGVNGRPQNVLAITEFTRTEREELNEARINAIRNVPSLGIETYGNVTLVSASAEPAWEELSAARLFMYVSSEGEQILETFVFDEIDPHGLLFQRAGGALQAFLESLGAQLYNPASKAVNVGSSVNTPETIKKHQLNAAILVQPSPAAETVTLNITAKGV